MCRKRSGSAPAPCPWIVVIRAVQLQLAVLHVVKAGTGERPSIYTPASPRTFQALLRETCFYILRFIALLLNSLPSSAIKGKVRYGEGEFF